MALDVTVARHRAASVWSGFTSGQKTMLGLAVAAVIMGGFLITSSIVTTARRNNEVNVSWFQM